MLKVVLSIDLQNLAQSVERLMGIMPRLVRNIKSDMVREANI